MYCTYLTIYYGDKMPKRYIGSSSISKVNLGYNGSVSSKKWKSLYESEQLNNKHLFKTRILTKHTTSLEAREMERILHMRYNVVASSEYFNESIAIPNGYFGRDVSGKNNPMFGISRKGEKHKGGENISSSLKKLYKSKEGILLKIAMSERLRTKNPSSDPTIMKKIKETWKNKERGVGEKNGMFGKTGKLKGKTLYNDGFKVKAFYPSDVPEGWVKGRLPKL
jgi:hypothetical protein